MLFVSSKAQKSPPWKWQALYNFQASALVSFGAIYLSTYLFIYAGCSNDPNYQANQLSKP
jgi:hypothetical protein